MLPILWLLLQHSIHIYIYFCRVHICKTVYVHVRCNDREWKENTNRRQKMNEKKSLFFCIFVLWQFFFSRMRLFVFFLVSWKFSLFLLLFFHLFIYLFNIVSSPCSHVACTWLTHATNVSNKTRRQDKENFSIRHGLVCGYKIFVCEILSILGICFALLPSSSSFSISSSSLFHIQKWLTQM